MRVDDDETWWLTKRSITGILIERKEEPTILAVEHQGRIAYRIDLCAMKPVTTLFRRRKSTMGSPSAVTVLGNTYSSGEVEQIAASGWMHNNDTELGMRILNAATGLTEEERLQKCVEWKDVLAAFQDLPKVRQTIRLG